VLLTCGRVVSLATRPHTFDAPTVNSALGAAEQVAPLAVWTVHATSESEHQAMHVFTVCTAPNPEDDGGDLSADYPLSRLELYVTAEDAVEAAKAEVAQLLDDDVNPPAVEYPDLRGRQTFGAVVTDSFTVTWVDVRECNIQS
jgi:hypothetical protein